MTHAALFIAVIVAIVSIFAVLPSSPSRQGVLGSATPPGTVLVTGFATVRSSTTPWIAVWVKFTNGTGFTYYADIGGPNYDPIVGGTFTIDLPANNMYTVQVTGQILGHQMSCIAGALTLNATSTTIRHIYICRLPDYP